MSENIKLLFDLPSGPGQQGAPGQAQNPAATADDTGQAAEAESQMRKALGLLGENARHRPEAERQDQPTRGLDRFNGGLHRRRFVQDGDVPVTVVRREPGHEAPAHRSAATVAAPSSSRLQRTEAALAAETAARERAERALAEAQASTRDLQTKIGHAELAKNEAVGALRREQEAIASLRSELDALHARAQEAEARAEAAEDTVREHQGMIADERQSRRALEKTFRSTELALSAANQLVQALSEEPLPTSGAGPVRRRRATDESEAIVGTATGAVKRGRPPTVVEPEQEPEPVKWWLNPKPASKRR